MKSGEMDTRTIQIAITFSAEEQAVLERYLAEINGVVRSSNAVVRELKMTLITEEWTEEQAIRSLLGAAIERERRIQMLQDNRDDPPWISILVYEAMQGIGDHDHS